MLASVLALRPAQREDHRAFAGLFLHLEVPDPVPDEEAWGSQIAPSSTLAERDGQVVGYLFAEQFSSTLYVRHVVSAPEQRRSGVARALLVNAAARAQAAGADTWFLNVKEENAPAIRLYESLGMRVCGKTQVVRLPWGALDDVAVDGIRVTTPNAADDAALERALGLLTGHLGRERALGKVLRAAHRGDAPLGFASFAKGFPGCFPFRARDVAGVAALVRALAPHRVPLEGELWRRTHLQLVLEDASALTEALVARGALQVMQIQQMRGALADVSG